MPEEKILELSFDNNTIEHLGIQMYKTLPPVLAELISNAYDADADTVQIELIQNEQDEEKKIIITDDGIGMSFEDLNNKFLVIGRNRRTDDTVTGNITAKKRLVTGRKGLGKLSIFGIAGKIIVESVKNNKKTKFKMDLNKILESSNGYYTPDLIINNVTVDEPNGTKITLDEIKRKSPFDLEVLKYNIASRFAFTDPNFVVGIKFGNDEQNSCLIDNRTAWDNFEHQFKWPYANDDEFCRKNNINGCIYSTKLPLPVGQKGVKLFARGKLVNDFDFFDQKTSSSHAYDYITGYLNIDYIDNDPKTDLITTSRDGLVWDNERLDDLRLWLNEELSKIAREWKDRRVKERKDSLNKKRQISCDAWIKKLPNHESKLAVKLVNEIISNDNIEEDKAILLLEYVENSFQYASFKEFAESLDNLSFEEEGSALKLLDLFKEWELIESKEFYRLSIGRVEAIKKLEKLVAENAKEVPDIHNFLERFPWLIDPRIRNFESEITYSSLLKDKFPESEEKPEHDRRIDFFCMDFNNDIYIFELKRPKSKATSKEITQLASYKEFVQSCSGNSKDSVKNIFCYLICGGVSEHSEGAKEIAKGMTSTGVYVTSYYDLLRNARTYHSEFIEKYEKMIEPQK